MGLNTTYLYGLPEFKDDERNSVTVKLAPAYVYQFIQVRGDFLYYFPTKWEHLKVHKISIDLFDGNLKSKISTFKLTVTNSAPYFRQSLPNVKMLLKEELEYVLPMPADDEMNEVSITL